MSTGGPDHQRAPGVMAVLLLVEELLMACRASRYRAMGLVGPVLSDASFPETPTPLY